MVAFHKCAVALFDEVPPTIEQIAAVVGESIEQYQAAQRGEYGSLDLLHAWLRRWEEEGYPSLELVIRVGHAKVRRVPSD